MWACSSCMKAMCRTWDFSHKNWTKQRCSLSFSTPSGSLCFDMLLLRTFFPWILVLALLSVCSGARDRGRSKGVTRAQRSGNRSRSGRFTLNSGLQCTWASKDVSDTVNLLVKCENPQARVTGGVTDLKCEYRARPQTCPGYQSDPRGYYKQVSRALKKLQGKLCQDDHALVKAGMCRRAPRDAHYKLLSTSVVVSAQSGQEPTALLRTPPSTRSTTTTTAAAPSGTPTDCKRHADHRKVAQEYCNSSWASVCAFFFSMLQSDDC